MHQYNKRYSRKIMQQLYYTINVYIGSGKKERKLKTKIYLHASKSFQENVFTGYV
jgi:hypothetical protein